MGWELVKSSQTPYIYKYSGISKNNNFGELFLGFFLNQVVFYIKYKDFWGKFKYFPQLFFKNFLLYYY